MRKDKRERWWCATVWYEKEGFKADFEKIRKSFRFYGYGLEVCPKTGANHWQFYGYRKFASESKVGVARCFGGGKYAHCEPCYGDDDQNFVYCNKDGKYIEWGKKPAQGERPDIQSVMYDVEDGMTELGIAQSSPALWCQYGSRFERYRELLRADREWVPEVRVYYGEPGSGKTRAAKEWLGEHDSVQWVSHQFMIGYSGSDNTLFDDFDSTSMNREFWLQLTDRYKMVVNVKNGERKWNCKKIAFTSNFAPDMWWGEDVAVQRRITIAQKYPQGNTGPEDG